MHIYNNGTNVMYRKPFHYQFAYAWKISKTAVKTMLIVDETKMLNYGIVQ